MKNFVLGSVFGVIVIVVLFSFLKPSLVSSLVSKEDVKVDLVGKCVSRTAVESFESLSDVNMIRVLFEGEHKYLVLVYNKPSIMTQFKGNYSFETVGKDEVLVDKTIDEYVVVSCKKELKIANFKKHESYNDTITNSNISSIDENNKKIKISFK